MSMTVHSYHTIPFLSCNVAHTIDTTTFISYHRDGYNIPLQYIPYPSLSHPSLTNHLTINTALPSPHCRTGKYSTVQSFTSPPHNLLLTQTAHNHLHHLDIN